MNFMRLHVLLFFIPNSFFYAKWTRFLAPLFPLMILFAVMFVLKLYAWFENKLITSKKFHKENAEILAQTLMLVVVLFISVPGMAYVGIYERPDVRFTASEWVFENIPTGSTILSETANVVDIPVVPPGKDPSQYSRRYYNYISFNSYDLHENPILQEQFREYIKTADYIFVPSRRVFWNHTCARPDEVSSSNVDCIEAGYEFDRWEKLASTYSTLSDYYINLFSGQLGYQKVAEFSSFPKLEFMGYTLYELDDENAEETWAVFDHPVVRVYKRG